MSQKLLSTVLYHNVLVLQQGQRICFQILLPRDTMRIIGIETSIHNNSGNASVLGRRYFTAGVLTLQASGTVDLCYSNHIMVESQRMLPTDLGYKTFRAGFINSKALDIDAVAQWGHHEPDLLNIAAPRMLFGTYTDLWDTDRDKNVAYQLSIHLWVTVNDLYNTPCE